MSIEEPPIPSSEELREFAVLANTCSELPGPRLDDHVCKHFD